MALYKYVYDYDYDYGASTDWGGGHLIAAYYLFIYLERMKYWVGLVDRPIADSLPT